MPYKTNQPLSPGEIHNKSTGSTYHFPGSKFIRWYRRNILKTMPPVEYHDGVEKAIDVAGLP